MQRSTCSHLCRASLLLVASLAMPGCIAWEIKDEVHAANERISEVDGVLIRTGHTLEGTNERLDRTDALHRMALHGPTGPALLREVSVLAAGPSLGDLRPGMACVVSLDGRKVVVDRWDSTGEVGLELTMDATDVEFVWRRLIESSCCVSVLAASDASRITSSLRIRGSSGVS